MHKKTFTNGKLINNLKQFLVVLIINIASTVKESYLKTMKLFMFL